MNIIFTMNAAVIGCGLIGQKRVKALNDAGGGQVIACADIDIRRAENLAPAGARAYSDWHKIIDSKDVDIVFVATMHDSLAEITLAAVESGKHVLVEKPAGRCAAEIDPIIEVAERNNSIVRIGFNHRYHRALRKAKELIEAGELGPLMFIRGRYGHGGRVGYDKEWRSNKEISGGGELIDQGVHLIDLSRYFLGDFSDVTGFAHTYFWNMSVDDNGFMMLKTRQNQTAWLHASCTEWKNMFSFEIYGRDGKIDINGLGGSYGMERITFYKMLPEMGPPETTVWEYPMADDSWTFETKHFIEDIHNGRNTGPNLHDARAALSIVEKIYEVSNL